MTVKEFMDVLNEVDEDFSVNFIQSGTCKPGDKWIERKDMDMPVFQCEIGGHVDMTTQVNKDPDEVTVKDFKEEFYDCDDDSEVRIYNEYGQAWENLGWDIGYSDRVVGFSGTV